MKLSAGSTEAVSAIIPPRPRPSTTSPSCPSRETAGVDSMGLAVVEVVVVGIGELKSSPKRSSIVETNYSVLLGLLN